MPLCKPADLANSLPRGGRLLGLDVSKKHIGIAITDPARTTVLPLTTLVRRKWADDMAALAAIGQDRAIAGIIIGLPLNMDGSRGPRAQSVITFGHNLLKESGVFAATPLITFWDERLTTQEAIDILGKNVSYGGATDQIAAVLILQDFLINHC